MVVKKAFFMFLFVIIAGCLNACRQGVTEENIQIAMTYVAETQSVQSPTPAPTSTPLPQPSVTIAPTVLPPTPAPDTASSGVPDIASSDSDVSWQDAHFYFGETVTVCGPVVGTHFASGSNGKPTFLNIGEDYPSRDRFVVVIWGDNRDDFSDAPENYYLGKEICITGEIEEYDGLYQIEIERPADIEMGD